MRMRTQIAAIFCAAALAATALAVSYTWTGDSDSDWDNADNWYAKGYEGYPDSTQHDAILPEEDVTTYDINLITVGIDDLEIQASYNFTAASGTPTLTVKSFTINAGDSDSTIVVEITGATIEKTNPE